VNNIQRAHHLRPHHTETVRLSSDPNVLEKMTDVIGLYLKPPSWAIVQQSNQMRRRRVFLSVEDLQASIAAFLDAWNESPSPFCLDCNSGVNTRETHPMPQNA